MLTAHAVSHPGNVRKINEDSWRASASHGIFIVADGMGGHNAGEVASGLAVEAVHGFVLRTLEDDDVTWPYGIDPQLSFNANRLLTAVKLANRRVFKAGESRDDYTGMGTTVVAGLVEDGQLTFVGVGDSRLYSFRAGQLEQLTTDDSWVAAMAAEGLMSEPAQASHPMRHVLTNVIGAREHLEARAQERTLVDGDLLVLCSDGLYGEVNPDTMTALVASETDPAKIAEKLVAKALEGRASDNVTALVVHYKA